MDKINEVLTKIVAYELFAPPERGGYIRTFNPGYKMKTAHSHDLVEVICVLRGFCYISVNGQCIRIKKNDCLIIFPNAEHFHFLGNNGSCRLINVHFKLGDASDFFSMDTLQGSLRFFYELRTNTRSYFKLIDNNSLSSISEKIVYEEENKNAYSEVLLKLYFCELYIQLSKVIREVCSTFEKPVNEHVSKALEYINGNYSEKLAADGLAKYIGVSTRHISRLFSETLGTTMNDYINELRIRKAKELLGTNKMDITDVALSVGFSTSQYFAKCFKKYESISPKQYKKLLLTKLDT